MRRFFIDPQHMFWLRNKKNNFLLRTLNWRPDEKTVSSDSLSTSIRLILKRQQLSMYQEIRSQILIPDLSLCKLDTCKLVLRQTVKTQMKCCRMLHSLGSELFAMTKIDIWRKQNIIWKLKPVTPVIMLNLLYSKTCLKRPLKEDQKKKFSRPIIT